MVITHRLASIKDADQIVVMKHGKVMEQGRHQELLKIQKEYYKLYNKQLKETNNTKLLINWYKLIEQRTVLNSLVWFNLTLGISMYNIAKTWLEFIEG